MVDDTGYRAGYRVCFHGYSWWADTVDEAQSQLERAEHELAEGDIDKWFYAGRPMDEASK